MNTVLKTDVERTGEAISPTQECVGNRLANLLAILRRDQQALKTDHRLLTANCTDDVAIANAN